MYVEYINILIHKNSGGPFRSLLLKTDVQNVDLK